MQDVRSLYISNSQSYEIKIAYLGTTVAVKRLRVQKVHRKRLQQFEEEISLFVKLNHPNIIKLVKSFYIIHYFSL